MTKTQQNVIIRGKMGISALGKAVVQLAQLDSSDKWHNLQLKPRLALVKTRLRVLTLSFTSAKILPAGRKVREESREKEKERREEKEEGR